MGWANCGTDSQGRLIGYTHEAICDYPGCKKEIDRGLSYACGDMHGEDEISCERYFCEEHKRDLVRQPWTGGRRVSVCNECFRACLEYGYDEETEAWKKD